MCGCSCAWVQLCVGAVVRGCSCARVQLCAGAVVRGCSCVRVQLCAGAVVCECSGAQNSNKCKDNMQCTTYTLYLASRG